MLSTFNDERCSPADGVQNESKGLESRLGDQLDEIAVFALVAVAVVYIAAASCWFLF